MPKISELSARADGMWARVEMIDCEETITLWTEAEKLAACKSYAAAENETLTKERDDLRAAVEALFAGGFIEAGTREHEPTEWGQELAARLAPLRNALTPS